MNTNDISNPNVRKAIEALEKNDISKWYSCFAIDVVFSDDGNPKEFKSFFDNAFVHKEKFTSFDSIKEGGKKLIGDFYAGQWGSFKVYFNFTLDDNGLISHLDIGQTSKL